MIRRTITTLTLAALTTIAVVAAAPALAAPPSTDPSPSIDMPSSDPCVVTTDSGTIPCLNLDWDFGFFFDPAPEADGATDGGIVLDVPGIVVDPGILIVDVPLDTIVDLTPPAEDPAPAVEEDVERAAPIVPEDEAEPHRDETTTTTAPHGDAPVVESAPLPVEEVAPATASTVPVDAVDDELTNDEVAVAALPISNSGTDQGSPFNPMMAAVLGALGALGIAVLTIAAFAAGRKRS